jgi:UrcA family protein
MRNWFNHKQIFISIVCLILSLPAVTTAVVTQNQTRTVSVSDLNLSNEKGIETLYQRLTISASKVCGPKESYGTGHRIESRKSRNQFETCSTEALNSAVQSINNEQLTALHAQ